jgi:signal transduction histidine kinase
MWFEFLRSGQLESRSNTWAAAWIFALALCGATVGLVWLGYITTREWRAGTDQLLERRQAEALSLVGNALNGDMRGVWTTVIVPINPLTIEQEPPLDLIQLTTRAFARFPYPESFIVWKQNGSDAGVTYAFNRTDRQPPWDNAEPTDEPFPVTLVQNPPALTELICALRAQAVAGNSFAFLELSIAGVPYQVVAHFIFDSSKPHAVLGLAAFTVNLDWVRRDYFGPLLNQVATIGGYAGALSLAAIDDRGSLLGSTGSSAQPANGLKWSFPMVFLDPSAINLTPVARAAIREGSIYVWPNADNTQLTALQGTQVVFVLMVLAAAASMLALLLTFRVIRANAELASMKSDFVSNVTHELKTPLALIRLVGDTLSSGRYTSTEAIRDYARMLSREAWRLTESINTLLAAARYSDSSQRALIDPTPTEVADLVEGSLERFRPTLEHLDFELDVDVPRNLPQVRADRPAMIQVIENVIDNAIKYSDSRRALRIAAHANGKHVRVTISDRGIGIPADDLGRVFERFYRGRNAKASGSGLGLAIARRIVQFHGGNITIDSAVDVGTHVCLSLAIEK